MEQHITKDHNLWAYVFYMVHLDSTDTSDHNGIESYVFRAFTEKDIAWIPRHRALCIEAADLSLDHDEQPQEDVSEHFH